MTTALPADPNLVGAFLQEVLRTNGFTTYGAVAERFDLPPMDGAWKGHPLADIFEVLDQQDANAGRGFRTSVVVQAVEKVPGGGFFEAVQRLTGTAITRSSRDAVWIDHLKRAQAEARTA